MSETASVAMAYPTAGSAPRSGVGLKPDVAGFYDEATGSVQYVVTDPITRRCAIIDPVLDFDPASGSTQRRPPIDYCGISRRMGSPWNGSSIRIRTRTIFPPLLILRT